MKLNSERRFSLFSDTNIVFGDDCRMPEVGESSRVMEEEPLDIHVVCEELHGTEPVQAVAAANEEEEDPEEDPMDEQSEGSGERSEGSEGQSEESEGRSPVFHTFDDDILGEYADRIVELEDKVAELEAEKQEQQSSLVQFEALVHHLVARNTELGDQLHEAEHTNAGLRASLEGETGDRVRAEQSWDRTLDRMADLEREVRARDTRMDRMSYAFWSAFSRLKDRVVRYPAEDGQTNHTMSRELVVHIVEGAYGDAVERGLLH